MTAPHDLPYAVAGREDFRSTVTIVLPSWTLDGSVIRSVSLTVEEARELSKLVAEAAEEAWRIHS